MAAGSRYRQWQADQLALRRQDPDAAAAMIAAARANARSTDMRRFARLSTRQGEIAAEEREQIDGATSLAITLASIALLAIPLLLAVLVVASARRVSRPLQRLARAAHRVQEGDLEARVEEDGNNEVADLARSFNAMAQSLAEARVELEQHNAELEAQGGQLAATVGELELEKARIETFHDVVSAFAAEVELDRLGPLLLSKLRGVAGARGGALYVADPIQIERGLALYETAAIDPATLPARFTPDAVERELVRHLLLPLASSGRPLGVVTLLDPVSRDLATLQRMADAGAIALSNALALQTARHRADVNRAVLETAHDAFIAVDADARITVWTPQAEALFGYTAKEARGAPIDELVVPGALARGLPSRARRAAGDTHRDAALPPAGGAPGRPAADDRGLGLTAAGRRQLADQRLRARHRRPRGPGACS